MLHEDSEMESVLKIHIPAGNSIWLRLVARIKD
jgi:hypothetical protein